MRRASSSGMIRTAFAFAACIAVAACGDAEPAADEENVSLDAPEPAAAGAAGGEAVSTGERTAEGMVWTFAESPDGATLTYGEPATDNLRLMLRCAGDGRIAVSHLRGSGGGGEQLALRSGGARETAAAAESDSELGGVSIAATLPADAPTLARFREGNSLTVEYAGETRTVPPAGAEAQRLFDACTAR